MKSLFTQIQTVTTVFIRKMFFLMAIWTKKNYIFRKIISAFSVFMVNLKYPIYSIVSTIEALGGLIKKCKFGKSTCSVIDMIFPAMTRTTSTRTISLVAKSSCSKVFSTVNAMSQWTFFFARKISTFIRTMFSIGIRSHMGKFLSTLDARFGQSLQMNTFSHMD